MKNYYLVFIFVFSTSFLMAQFTITITEKDGSSRTITKTTDDAFNTIYTEEFTSKEGRIYKKVVWKKDGLGRWEITTMKKDPKNKAEYIADQAIRMNEKGAITWLDYFDDEHPPSTFDVDDPANRKEENAHRIRVFNWFDNLKKDTQPPPFPKRNDGSSKKKVDKKVSIYIGPSILNGGSGSNRESYFGGQAYALFNINSNIGVGADFSLNTKKDGNLKVTQSLILARGQYDFFKGNKNDKKVIPEAHVLAGLGLDSFKYTSSGNSSKSSGSGPAFGVGAGVGINVSPNINIGVSVDYVGVKYENSNGTNSNIRGSAGIIFGLGGGGQKEYPDEDLLNW